MEAFRRIVPPCRRQSSSITLAALLAPRYNESKVTASESSKRLAHSLKLHVPSNSDDDVKAEDSARLPEVARLCRVCGGLLRLCCRRIYHTLSYDASLSGCRHCFCLQYDYIRDRTRALRLRVTIRPQCKHRSTLPDLNIPQHAKAWRSFRFHEETQSHSLCVGHIRDTPRCHGLTININQGDLGLAIPAVSARLHVPNHTTVD